MKVRPSEFIHPDCHAAVTSPFGTADYFAPATTRLALLVQRGGCAKASCAVHVEGVPGEGCAKTQEGNSFTISC